MFSWAKELLSPTVQTGKPVLTNNEATDSRRKSADGEMTEEGFVCVGRSSFYQSPEMPAISQSYVIHPQHQQTSPPVVPNIYSTGGPSTMYPVLPQNPAMQLNLVGMDNGDFVKRIPFSLRSGLSTGSAGSSRHTQQKPFEVYLTQFRSHSRERYEYDFNFERGVIREMEQSSGCY